MVKPISSCSVSRRKYLKKNLGPILVLPWSYLGPTLILPWSYLGPTLVLLWSYLDPILVLLWSYLGPILVLPWSYLGPTLVLPWSYLGPTLILPWSYQGREDRHHHCAEVWAAVGCSNNLKNTFCTFTFYFSFSTFLFTYMFMFYFCFAFISFASPLLAWLKPFLPCCWILLRAPSQALRRVLKLHLRNLFNHQKNRSE